jgi:threonine synthase
LEAHGLEFFAERRSLRVHVLVSTTGDTGPAAIEAVRAHCRRVRVTAMYPLDRISELQRRQMTTVRAPNVRILPFEGEGDDLDGPIKALSLDAPFRDAHGLCAINSINLATRVASVSAGVRQS